MVESVECTDRADGERVGEFICVAARWIEVRVVI